MNFSLGAPTRLPLRRAAVLAAIATTATLALTGVTTPAGAAPAPATAPDLGSNVHVISPAMPQAQIQAVVDGVYAAQATDQFGERRDAILFLPGTYGSATDR